MRGLHLAESPRDIRTNCEHHRHHQGHYCFTGTLQNCYLYAKCQFHLPSTSAHQMWSQKYNGQPYHAQFSTVCSLFSKFLFPGEKKNNQKTLQSFRVLEFGGGVIWHRGRSPQIYTVRYSVTLWHCYSVTFKNLNVNSCSSSKSINDTFRACTNNNKKYIGSPPRSIIPLK